MTDIDIVKALMCCKDADCLSCPRWTEEWYSGQCNDFLQDVLDLINRQKAEIERLKKHNTDMARKHYNDGIKEFAERLKESAFAFGREHCEEAVTVLEIDNLVKEMTEETQ